MWVKYSREWSYNVHRIIVLFSVLSSQNVLIIWCVCCEYFHRIFVCPDSMIIHIIFLCYLGNYQRIGTHTIWRQNYYLGQHMKTDQLFYYWYNNNFMSFWTSPQIDIRIIQNNFHIYALKSDSVLFIISATINCKLKTNYRRGYYSHKGR